MTSAPLPYQLTCLALPPRVSASSSSLSASSAASGKADRGSLEEQKAVNEEFKVWKKNAPFLYDVLLIHALEWPSLTCQWLPEHSRGEGESGEEYETHRLILGTHTTDGEGNYLLIAETRLPVSIPSSAAAAAAGAGSSSERQGADGYGAVFGRLEIVQSINHSGEVNRARFMYGNSSVVATKSNQAEVWLFDRAQHAAKANRNSGCKPDYRLQGHEKEGYGLAWSEHKEGLILSSGEDGLVCLWDVAGSVGKKAAGSGGGGGDGSVVLSPLSTFKSHTANVEDVAWSCQSVSTFASCGDDHCVMLWDTRTKPSSPAASAQPHNAEINCLSFSPYQPNLLLSGSADCTLALLDMRQLSSKIHSFESHTDQVFACQWSPHAGSVFASGSGDRRVCVWDVGRVGEEQTAEDAEDGPPELMFVHGGHTDKVGDISWLGDSGSRARAGGDGSSSSGGGSSWPGDEWVIASVADDNIVQIWEMAESIYRDEEDDDVDRGGRMTDEDYE